MPPKPTNNPRRPPAISTASRRTAIPIDSASQTPTPAIASADPTNPPIDPSLTALRSRNVPSPSTITASGSPPRAGVQRLQSLKKRTPAGSLIPLNPDGTAPKPTLRYQPRAVVRKSKEEREALERLEVERQQERLKEAAALRKVDAAAAGRGGDRLVRGRGRGMGRGKGMFVAGDVSGPLGSGMSIRSRGGGFGAASGKGKHRHGHGTRSGAGRVHGLVRAKSEDEVGGIDGPGGSGDISSDEGSDGGPRFSIEQINIISDDEQELGEEGDFEEGNGKGKMRARSPTGDRTGKGLRPVRVERQEHQERSIGINTDASSEKSAELRRQARTKVKEKHGGVESLFVQDSEEEADDARGGEGDDLVEITSEKAVGGTLYGGIRIKEEPTDDRDVLMTDAIPQGVDDRPATSDTGPLAPTAPKPKARKSKVTIHDPRSKLQTEEERQEWDRHEQDIEHIKQALGTITTHDPPAEESQDAEQEDETKAVEAPRDERSGRLFLIQFPPMTPNLVPPWPDMDEMDQDVVETGARASTQQSPNPTIKKEVTDGLTAPMPTLSGNGTVIPAPLITATNSTLPPGRVVLS
ncbi:DNA-directed RNA polymerase III [Histoplasma capsulatum var. duboisii H88]|uniref:DNA-directed RNA polymerase III n=1 Tax=Ajellomyces capsulatus (strain H88) TaxID=544711 RepID=F0UBJ2_AJEC8|nr:DNA-directed RNA polymerase III [Histoplasma capsulatum var. duboisii H88]